MSCRTPMVSVAICLVLGGCGTARPLLQTGGKAFGDGASAASNVISQEVSSAPESERKIFIFADLPDSVQSDKSFDARFGDFACSGVGEGAQAAANVAATTGVAKTVGDLTADAPADLGKALASLSKYSDNPPPVAELPKAPKDQHKACLNKVSDGLEVVREGPPVQETVAVAAVFAAADAAKALYTSVKTALTLIAQKADEQQRLRVLKEFLEDPKTNQAMVAALGKCADYGPNSVKPDNTLADIPDCDGPLGKSGEINILYRRHVASTLVLPFVQFVDTQRNLSSLQPHEIVERLSTVDSNLAAFDAMKDRQDPGDLAKPIAKAYLDLRRINDGKLTDKEKQTALSKDLADFAAFVTQLDKDVTDIEAKGKAASQAVNKL